MVVLLLCNELNETGNVYVVHLTLGITLKRSNGYVTLNSLIYVVNKRFFTGFILLDFFAFLYAMRYFRRMLYDT